MKTQAMLAYFPFFGWFFPLFVSKAAAEDTFAQFHARQGLGASFAFVAAMVAVWFVGNALFSFLNFIVYAGYIAAVVLYVWLLVSGVRNVRSGEKKPLPWIGEKAARLSV